MTEAQPPPSYEERMLVIHPNKPEWGPGRILAIVGTKLTVYFRDRRSESAADAAVTVDTRYVPLDVAPEQSDSFLDNLPPYQDGSFKGVKKRPVSLEEGIETFRRHYPHGFEDVAYIRRERDYKWAAREHWVQTLGDGRAEGLLEDGDVGELRRRAQSVEAKTNLLAVFEKAAFRDGLREDDAATRYFTALISLLGAPDLDRHLFEAYLHAVESLPAREGKASPVKWTVATILPFLAQPERFMFLKPEVTQECAARLCYDLAYQARPNWLTYARLMEMTGTLMERLRPYGARDFIDAQSFIWLLGYFDEQ